MDEARDYGERTDAILERVRALIATWREHAKQADRWAAEHDAARDGANSHAFRKERRIWTTCADELGAALNETTDGAEKPVDGRGTTPVSEPLA